MTEIPLTPEMMRGLPEPDEQGIIRVTAGLRIDEAQGVARIVELNDAPVDGGPQEDEEAMPGPGEIEKGIYASDAS